MAKFDTIEEDLDGASSDVDVLDPEELRVRKFEFEVAELDPDESGGVLDVNVCDPDEVVMFLT